MTFETTKTTKTTTEPANKQIPQRHYQQAGDHLQQAATKHLDAAKMPGSGDHKAADQKAKIASDHTAPASQHVSQSVKVPAPSASSHTIHAK